MSEGTNATDKPAIEYKDQVGNPLVLPPRFTGTLEEFAKVVSELKPKHCSYPTGRPLSRRSGLPCRAHAMPNGRCRIHGGKIKRGPENKNFKGNKLEAIVPADIAKRIKAADADPNLLSIRSDAALLWARQSVLAERLHSGESGALWQSLNAQWQAFVTASRLAREAGEKDDFEKRAKYAAAGQNAINEIGRLIQQGNKDELVWRDLISVTNNLVDLKAKEHGRLKDLSQMMYADDVMNVASLLMAAVFDEIKDTAVVYRVGERFNQIVNKGNPMAFVSEAKAAAMIPMAPTLEAKKDG